MFSKHTFPPKRHKKYVFKTYFSIKRAQKVCFENILFSQNARKVCFQNRLCSQNAQKVCFQNILFGQKGKNVHVWSGLRAPLDGRTRGRCSKNKFPPRFSENPPKTGKMHFLPHFGLFSENRDESIKIAFHCGFLKTGQNELKSAFYPVLVGFSENHMRFLGDYLYF
jgi:hypothetical protein